MIQAHTGYRTITHVVDGKIKECENVFAYTYIYIYIYIYTYTLPSRIHVTSRQLIF